MIILHIETSTNICSVAISENGSILFNDLDDKGMNHAALLPVFIQKSFDFLKTVHKKLNAVAVSGGPGSYTGLRIGVSTAKGICYGLDLPLISVSTLEIISSAPLRHHTFERQALLCPMIDARRMEVYSAFYTPDLKIYREISADIITSDSFTEILDNYVVYFMGNGSVKCKSILTHPHARFIDEIVPLAENMIHLAEKSFSEKKFVDTAYFEPFYLKEFQATIPKNKLNSGN